jgi:hypothetical protein
VGHSRVEMNKGSVACVLVLVGGIGDFNFGVTKFGSDCEGLMDCVNIGIGEVSATICTDDTMTIINHRTHEVNYYQCIHNSCVRDDGMEEKCKRK